MNIGVLFFMRLLRLHRRRFASIDRRLWLVLTEALRPHEDGLSATPNLKS